MYRTEEMIREIEEKEIMKQKEKERKLIENNKKIQEEYEKEIKQIEKWSLTKYKEMIFDTDINDWEKNTSEFDNYIFGKIQPKVFFTLRTSYSII